ncbi:TetR/AcrR family transcriptional regulator [Streptomyces sp. SM11]|uniref:TetR/AcrR family transcriptional regulator n=1 Tax=Streptomyces sp. SM11 TaxID=565557 RepID=UPI000CD5947D|nr:TetR/AcrR family transcriptional regulator [Streptomyces sp. SM11]
MSEELTPQQRAARTKRMRSINQTVEAAHVLFDAHGWYGVTIEDVAKESGVSTATISTYFPTKQDVVIGAYASTLIPVTERADAEQEPRDAMIGLVTELADATLASPALAIALLPACRDIKPSGTASVTTEMTTVGFNRLAELLGRLLQSYRNSDDNLTEVAEFYLSGLLAWVLKHPDRSGDDAATLALSQLL